MKEKTKGRIEKLAILLVLLIFVAFVAWVVNLGMNSSIDGSEVKSISASEAAKLSDAATEKRLTNILTNSGFDVKSVEVSGSVAHFDIYDVGMLPDYQKKQIMITLAKLAHQQTRENVLNAYLYDEYGIKVASAKYLFYSGEWNVKLY